MISPLRPEEILAVSALTAERRVEHFIKRTVDHQEVWGIRKGDWALSANSSGVTVFQVWPFDDYAQLCCVGEWADCVPASMELDFFIDTFVPNLCEQGIAVGVFYTPTDNGILMPPNELADRMRAYEDQWY